MRVSDLFNTHVKEGEYFDDETRRIAHRAVENLGAQHVVLPRQFSTQSVECGPCRLHRGLLIDAVEHYLLTLRPSRKPRVVRERERRRADLLAWFDAADAPILFSTCAAVLGPAAR